MKSKGSKWKHSYRQKLTQLANCALEDLVIEQAHGLNADARVQLANVYRRWSDQLLNSAELMRSTRAARAKQKTYFLALQLRSSVN